MPVEVNNSAHNLTIESHFSVERKAWSPGFKMCAHAKRAYIEVCRDAHGKFGEHERCVRVA